MKRVEGYSNLSRNETGAIVNTDSSAFQAYKKRQAKKKVKDDSITSLQDQLEEAKDQIEELKKLVHDALNGKFDK